MSVPKQQLWLMAQDIEGSGVVCVSSCGFDSHLQ